jgi:hypothetical protein
VFEPRFGRYPCTLLREFSDQWRLSTSGIIHLPVPLAAAGESEAIVSLAISYELPMLYQGHSGQDFRRVRGCRSGSRHLSGLTGLRLDAWFDGEILMSGCDADGKTNDDADVAFGGSLEVIVVRRVGGWIGNGSQHLRSGSN